MVNKKEPTMNKLRNYKKVTLRRQKSWSDTQNTTDNLSSKMRTQRFLGIRLDTIEEHGTCYFSKLISSGQIKRFEKNPKKLFGVSQMIYNASQIKKFNL